MPVIDGISLPFLPPGGVNGLGGKSSKPELQEAKSSFKDVFEDELNKIKFSNHARTRLTSREVPLSGEEVDRLQKAVEIAHNKGSNESLIMMENSCFIVNIPNKTVVTVMSTEQMSDNIITNIDSAVFA